MPDCVKAHGHQGFLCLYGFEFPDLAVTKYDETHGIERPDDCDRHSWMSERKRAIMHEHARELSLTFSASIAMLSLSNSRVPGACDEDVIYFAFMGKGHLVAVQCPNAGKIKEMMQVLGVEGEPHWIMA
ncbi:hypothetical protein AURDEDRAFT_109515 [Auricularia subglabra TFB-10046 SS5]|nr:hypothetical protein AURDEDRAFT_109515 [Auricularia subglabra TFB-10046 SS5]